MILELIFVLFCLFVYINLITVERINDNGNANANAALLAESPQLGPVETKTPRFFHRQAKHQTNDLLSKLTFTLSWEFLKLVVLLQ